ncbi:MAG: hypothetical protein MI863_00585 [Desulfobacterales bacterium]|nr:hypothetical protein [Desulfobacterales bacterium]
MLTVSKWLIVACSVLTIFDQSTYVVEYGMPGIWSFLIVPVINLLFGIGMLMFAIKSTAFRKA